jgi:DNA polymerase III alpha subunit
MRKLNYLISCAHTDGFYRKPRIDLKQLFKFDKDEIFITSACVAGWKYEDAIGIWLDIWGHFGDSFFLEYQANNTDRQKEVNRKILELRRMYGIQTIIGLDTHYISNEDEIKRNNLLIRKKINYPEEEGWYMDFPNGVEAYKRMIEQKIVPPDEIILSMMNTHVFSTLCEDITYDTGFKIPILDQYRLLDYEERADILKGILKERFEGEDYEHLTDDRYEGMMYEFGEIKDSGTVDYFIDNTLLVGLAVKKYNGQLTTTSRGSASSYYSSKLLGFTTMDRFEAEVPIYPERFITKERILSSHQMPDIDFNVSDQQPFVSAARELFGEHGCYPLLAVGTLGEKSGFKLYADIAGIEPSIANDISKCIDQYNEDLKNAEDDDDKNAINIEDYILNEEHLRIFNDSKSYQGIVEQPKVHACGFMLFNGNIRQEDVVGYGDIRYEIGLIRCVSKSNSKSTIVANIEGGLLDSYGYVKDDFLIVDVVGIIYKLYHAINREVPTVSELRKMVTGDEPTWKMYEMGATCSLNQCEKPSTTKKVMKYKPRNIKELAAFIAGIRPGFKSLIEGFLSRIDYTNGEPAIDELLKDCFHYMLYQEAVMKIFSWLGIPMKDSYDTIKKISKKKLKGEALKHVEDTLMEHWMSNIGNLDNFEPVYKVIKDSARYSFNAPHALAMANDSLYEAWMKAHHMSVFYEVTLNHYKQKGDKDKVADLIREATTMFGYTMAEYEYGKDNSKFVIDDDTKTINPSLSSVKGIGAKAVGDMYAISQRGVNDFLDIYGSIKGTNINASIFQNLVKIGYFRKFGSIKKLLKAIEIYDYWKGSNGEGRKTISKANLPEFGLENIDIRKYATDIMMSGKVSTKQFTNVDWKGIAKELVSMIPDEEFGILQLVKFQYEVLGYTNYTDNDVEWRYVLVTNLDTAYSPKFRAYSINNGKIVEMKVHKTINKRDKIVKSSFKETPFEEGDILYIRNVKKQPKQQKVDDKWVDIPNTTEWWIKDYYKVV